MKLFSAVTAVTLLLCLKLPTTMTSVDQNTNSSSSNNINNINLAEEIDEFVQHVFDCHRSPALTLAVVKDGHVVLAKGYGFTTGAKTTKTTSKTRFAIGSLSKAFTSLLIAKAVQSSGGNITMDTPISQYIPNFRLTDDYRSQHVTMRDLLAHRTAIPGSELPELFGVSPDTSRKAFTRKLQYMSSPYSFRDKFIYNNYMYVLAGDILEQLSGGVTWEDLVNESIFSPLGMTDSGFVDRLQDFERDFAMPCEFLNDTLVDLLPAVLHVVHVFGPAGSIYSTAEDMAKWMKFLLSQKDDIWDATGLDPSLLDVIFEPSMTLSPGLRKGFSKPLHPASSASQNYGMGWWSGLYREFNRIMHSGGIATHSSRLILFPEMNAGLFAAVNGPFGGKRDLFRAIIYRVSDLLLGLPAWFNTSETCQEPYPWSIHNTDHATQNKTDEKSTGKEHVSESSYHFNETALLCSNLNMSAYVGTYSNKVLGDAIVTHNTSVPCRLVVSYGRIGLFHLSPLSKGNFSLTIMGPASFFNSYDFINRAEFRFDDVVASRVLSLSISVEDVADIFFKNDEEIPGSREGHNNASATTS